MERMRSVIGQQEYEAWLRPVELDDYRTEERVVLLAVPNEFYRRWIQKRYMDELRAAFSESIGVPIHVELLVDEEADASGSAEPEVHPTRTLNDPVAGNGQQDLLPRHDNRNEAPPPAGQTRQNFARRQTFPPSFPTPYRRAEEAAPPAGETATPPRLNSRYIFEEFVVGESNRFAHAAACAVAEPRGRSINPLFIYGGSGLGKTHLMQAIGQRLYQTDQRLRVLYVTSEQFINGFIDAIRTQKHVEFRAAYRNVDLLLIDDVQFLGGKERTQQEFFHTFNALYDAGKKVVVTCDRPPKDLAGLEERLRSRFLWGLLVDIQPPDLETRIAILRKKADQEGIQLPNEVILFIAERLTENIREMEGALKRLRMASSLHDRPIDLETARDLLGHLVVGTPQPTVGVEEVQRAVCNYFGIKVSELLGKNRSKKFSQPRHVAQYLCRKLTNLSFPDIAQKFGGKDHTSIIYACKKVDTAMQRDPNMAHVLEYLTRQVTKGSASEQ